MSASFVKNATHLSSSHQYVYKMLQNARLRQMVKDKADGITKGDELQKALSRISQLNKEKMVLTELSNRLRSELTKAGISLQKPPSASSNIPRDIRRDTRVSSAVQGKLDQLEKAQYDLMKARIAQSPRSPTSPPKSPNNIQAASPPTKQTKRQSAESKLRGKNQKLPTFVEQTSTSGSSFKAKGSAAIMRASRLKPSRGYVAPLPKSKPSSNVAWVKSSNRKPQYQIANEFDDLDSLSSQTAVVDPNSLAKSPSQGQRSHDINGMLDSLELGSSIQDVWKIIDDQASLNSSTPD